MSAVCPYCNVTVEDVEKHLASSLVKHPRMPVFVTADVQAEFDRLLEKADHWPNTFNVAGLGGFLLDHPELIGRDELPTRKANRLYREQRRQL